MDDVYALAICYLEKYNAVYFNIEKNILFIYHYTCTYIVVIQLVKFCHLSICRDDKERDTTTM